MQYFIKNCLLSTLLQSFLSKSTKMSSKKFHVQKNSKELIEVLCTEIGEIFRRASVFLFQVRFDKI